ncbi:molybdopterin-binding/glycosyltransferase family 2 protein [Aquibaculum sediminis]|uniref:molybdopterin-binding/glycosyltransferase family 2 protein n=1 Tax=Aquibaculum sediminis TaxID=3231907 RepID=UPI003451553C
MRFEETAVAEAEGTILAHSLRLGSLNFKKGRRLDAEDIRALQQARVETVIAARLEEEDVHEDAAAQRLAEAMAGTGTRTSAAFTGRCNILAARRGLLVYDRARLDAFNLEDEAITLAALAPFEVVEPKQMLATVKIIPFSAPKPALARCLEVAADPGRLLRVAAFQRKKVALVQTSLPGQKEALLDKTHEAIKQRLAALGIESLKESRCAHDSAAVAQAVARKVGEGAELVLVSGASAIVDRRDVVPSGIVKAGGEIEHFGMPVDPGNLMLMARIGEVPVLGLPGCARSPKLNGFDWVLQRVVADVPVRREDIMRMGAGGLLKESGARPLPRAEAVEDRSAPRAPRIATIVLAAGRSSRMGERNKLLEEIEGSPLVLHAVRAAKASQADSVLVVTGHEHEAVESVLAPEKVRTIHNPDYAHGLSTSLHRGLAALPDDCDGAVVLLGDMPKVTAEVIDRLIAAFSPVEGRSICLPMRQGRRGNPVLFARRYFAEVMEISGDLGARPLLGNYPDQVAEVPMPDDAVLTDVDTPEQLDALRGG